MHDMTTPLQGHNKNKKNNARAGRRWLLGIVESARKKEERKSPGFPAFRYATHLLIPAAAALAVAGFFLFSAPAAQAATGVVRRILIQAATSDELDEIVLESGELVYRVDDPKDVRIGDGLTTGGIRLWNFLALTNPPPVYDRDLDMAGHAIQLNERYTVKAEDGYLSIYHVGTSPVFRLVGREAAGSLGILGWDNSGTNVVLTVQHVEGDDPPVLETTASLEGDPIWTAIEYDLARLSPVAVSLTFPQPELGVFTYYRVSTSVTEPSASFFVPVYVNGEEVLTAETDPLWASWRTNAAAGTTNAILPSGGLVDIGPLLGASDASQWSGSAATQSVNMATHSIVNAGTVGASNLVLTGAGTTVLGRDVRSVDSYRADRHGISIGPNADAGQYAAVFGNCPTGRMYAAVFGDHSWANEYGCAAGYKAKAGMYGCAFGYESVSGFYGFSAGSQAKGTNGSFVYADSLVAAFDRTAHSNEFAVRARGGVYFETPEMVVTGRIKTAGLVLTSNTTNYLIRPDGGTNTISFDVDGNMIIAVDGTTALTIRTNGNVGIKGLGAAAYPLYVTGETVSTARMRAPEFRDSAASSYFLDPNGESILASIRMDGSLTVTQGVSQIILPSGTNGLVSGTLWNDAGTVKVMP